MHRFRTVLTSVAIIAVGLSGPPAPAAEPHEGEPAYGLRDGTVGFDGTARVLAHADDNAARTIRAWSVNTSAGIVYIGDDGRTRLAPAVGDEVVLRGQRNPHPPRGQESIAVSRDRATVIWTRVSEGKVGVTAYDVPAGLVVGRLDVPRSGPHGTTRVVGAASTLVFLDEKNGTWVWDLRPAAPEPYRLTDRAGRITSIGDGVLSRNGGSIIEHGRNLLGRDWNIVKTPKGTRLSADGRFAAQPFGDRLRAKKRSGDDTAWVTMRWRHAPLHPLDWNFAPDGHLSATVLAHRGSHVVSCHPATGHCESVVIVMAGRGRPILID